MIFSTQNPVFLLARIDRVKERWPIRGGLSSFLCSAMKTLTIGWDGKVEGKWANNRPCIFSVFLFCSEVFFCWFIRSRGAAIKPIRGQLTRSSPAQCKRLSLIGWRKEGRRGIKPLRAQLTRASSAQCMTSPYVRLPLIGWRKGRDGRGTNRRPPIISFLFKGWGHEIRDWVDQHYPQHAGGDGWTGLQQKVKAALLYGNDILSNSIYECLQYIVDTF